MSALRTFLRNHPRLASWIALSIGMIALFMWGAKGKGLTGGQLLGLCAMCVVVAGLCAWIIGWESS